MRNVASWLGLAFVVAVSLPLSGCNSCRRWRAGRISPSVIFGDTTDAEKLGADDVAHYLAVARAIIAQPPSQVMEPPSRPGRRVFVTWWSPGHAAVRATGLGSTLFDSVKLASEAIAKDASGDGRVELEIVTAVHSGSPQADESGSPHQMGLYGYAVYNGATVGWVAPSELILDKLVDERDTHPTKLKVHEIEALLAKRAGVTPAATSNMAKSRFKVVQWLEAATPGALPIELFRSQPPRPSQLSADELLGAVGDAADYIARAAGADGKFMYLYDPVRDRVEKGYDIARHAGAIYALMDAYNVLHVDTWKSAAERAIGYLAHACPASPDGAGCAAGEHEEQKRAGATGLGLTALSRYTEATGDRSRLDEMRELARFILHQQYPDGHFRANADVKKEDPSVDETKFAKEVTYYPGEATLGLIRLYALDRDPRWLEGAKKAADYVILVRDAKTDEAHQIHDHWMSYALLDLFRETKEPRYADHAFKIAHAIVLGEFRDTAVKQPDYLGAVHEKGPTTPSSTALEALAADIELCRTMGKSEEWLRDPAMDLAVFIWREQLVGDNLYFARNPDQARGGVREGLLAPDVRIDYPQHALSGWLHLAEELRDPSWGGARREDGGSPSSPEQRR
jgi:Beta-L-arabinofuranosidase, GH127